MLMVIIVRYISDMHGYGFGVFVLICTLAYTGDVGRKSDNDNGLQRSHYRHTI